MLLNRISATVIGLALLVGPGTMPTLAQQEVTPSEPAPAEVAPEPAPEEAPPEPTPEEVAPESKEVLPEPVQENVAPDPAQEEGTSTSGQGDLSEAQVFGGMVEEGSDENLYRMNEPKDKFEALPSCGSITYRGSSGYISVQTNSSSRIQWGITMTPLSLSVGRWDVDTWLNGRKTTSGFHRTTTGPYIPHGSIQARRGQTFVVTARLVSANGRTYTNVPNACTVP